MSHSAEIFKEKVKNEQNDNSYEPDHSEKIVDLKSFQMGHGRRESSQISNEVKNSCPDDPIENPISSSAHSDNNSSKFVLENKEASLKAQKANDKENQRFNHSVSKDDRILASYHPDLQTQKVTHKEDFDKLVKKILRTLNTNLSMAMQNGK